MQSSSAKLIGRSSWDETSGRERAGNSAGHGFDRRAVAGLDMARIHQRAADADEIGAGREISGEVARLDAAGRAEDHPREDAAQRADMSGATGGSGGEDLHRIGPGGKGGADLARRQRAKEERRPGLPA